MFKQGSTEHSIISKHYFQGNEVDQLFSILTKQFQTEIKTIEDLERLIVNSGILPKPDVETLDYIYNWKKYAVDNLATEELRNHSHYHGFNIKKQNGDARLRGKRYSFDSEWNPAAGIRLLREGAPLEPVGAAELRIEKLNLPRVFQDLQRFFVTLPLQERMVVQSSWERLRVKIENLPLEADRFPMMDLSKLPTLSVESPAIMPGHLAHLNKDDNYQDLEGDTFPEDLDEADFTEDLKRGLDVLIYSDVKTSRPWLGRILEVNIENSFTIQWFTRQKGDQNMFRAAINRDGSPYTSVLDSASVILWNFSTRVSDSSFSVSKFFLSQFKIEYLKHDSLLRRK